MRWTNLDAIIQSEVSQKEINRYHMLMYVYRTRKIVLMNLFAGQQWRNRHREQTYGHRERRGEGETWRE